MKSWQRLFCLGQHLVLAGLVLLLCSGCVQYRMELAFNWLGGGTIVQNLKWDEEVGKFVGKYSEAAINEFTHEIDRRTQAAGGRSDRLSDSEMMVEIPFESYTQLASKFNAFFDRPLQLLSSGKIPQAGYAVGDGKGMQPVLPSLLVDRVSGPKELEVSKQGFFFADRYDLSYVIDLTELSLPSSGGFLTLSADRLLDLRFALKTPIAASTSNATVRAGNQLEWHLDTGNLNQVTASFWTPSPVGIVVLVAAALSAFALAWRLLDRANPRR